MILTLTGLSGCGKSYLAKRLVEERGFQRFGCDDLIEAKLTRELSGAGLSSIEGVAKWMGQPYEQGYAEREAKYLACEREVMREIIAFLAQRRIDQKEKIVIDTSGSVIYTGNDVLSALRSSSKVIYMAVPDAELKFMYLQYLHDPKPVLWADNYAPRSGESGEQTLERCYPQLVRARTALYGKFAHITLMMDRTHRDQFSVTRLLQAVGVV